MDGDEAALVQLQAITRLEPLPVGIDQRHQRIGACKSCAASLAMRSKQGSAASPNSLRSFCTLPMR